ncbi:MAG: phosphatidate cytidylyltransferase [Puniceicoccales bacterium]|jgi:phosphatidate cytidylyltransferase|nr:phosphatidate cytidylyltransferase [Puniceicoccales bacterium]
MKNRLFSTLALWLTVGVALFFKIWGGLTFLLLLTGAAHWELCTLLRASGARPQREISVALGIIVQVGLCWSILSGGTAGAAMHGIYPVVLPGLLVSVVAFALLASPAKLVAVFVAAPTALSWLYIPCGIAPLTCLAAEFWANGRDVSGLLLVVWFIATVKFADCGALILGTRFGKHKLAPKISPGKSWEGAVGAVATAAAVGAGIAWLFGHYAAPLGWTVSGFTAGKAALLALPLAALGIPSDLVESVFKRHAGVKDSGNTIPGIGGAFDLLDSLILTAPAGYLLFKFFVI